MPRAVVGGLTSAARQVQGRTSAQCLQPSRRCSAAHVTAASFCIGGVHVLSGGSHFTLWMMFVTHLISVPRRRVGHGGMDSQVLRAFILVSHMTQNDRHGASTRPPRPTRLDGREVLTATADSETIWQLRCGALRGCNYDGGPWQCALRGDGAFNYSDLPQRT